MNLHDESDYHRLKNLVVENEYLERQQRTRKYVVIHAAFLGFAIGGLLARKQFPERETGVIENLLFGLSMLALLMLAPVLFRALSDHIRTTRKLRSGS